MSESASASPGWTWAGSHVTVLTLVRTQTPGRDSDGGPGGPRTRGGRLAAVTQSRCCRLAVTPSEREREREKERVSCLTRSPSLTLTPRGHHFQLVAGPCACARGLPTKATATDRCGKVEILADLITVTGFFIGHGASIAICRELLCSIDSARVDLIQFTIFEASVVILNSQQSNQ